MNSLRIGPFLRKHGWDIRSLGASKLTHRVLEHDLPLIVQAPEPIIFDVGANQGQTIELMQKLFPRCSVRAFEPAMELAALLRARYRAPDVVVECLGLGAIREERIFRHYGDSRLSSFLDIAQDPVNPFANTILTDEAAVPIVTIDEYSKEHGIERVHLLKVDTQGFDLNVLKGATRMFSANAIDCVLVEMNFIPLYVGQCRPGELMDWLGGFSFVPIAFFEQVRKRDALVWATACFVRY